LALPAPARFVVKDSPPEQLANAIRRVVAARPGSTVAEIAGKLFLSERTVRNYLSAAIAKTNARNRAEAVRNAEARGWI
jgi:two-component system, NarL family, response regulator DesR